MLFTVPHFGTGFLDFAGFAMRGGFRNFVRNRSFDDFPYQDLEQSWMVLGPVGEEFRLLDWLSERLPNPPIRPLEL